MMSKLNSAELLNALVEELQKWTERMSSSMEKSVIFASCWGMRVGVSRFYCVIDVERSLGSEGLDQC